MTLKAYSPLRIVTLNDKKGKYMQLDVKALKDACFQLARNTMWERKPVDLADIQSHAENLYSEAIQLEEFIVGQERDPNMLTRAVRYLDQTHAIPPMKDDTWWFYNMLSAIIELACPNMIQSQDSQEIFKDIEEGISIARSSSDD